MTHRHRRCRRAAAVEVKPWARGTGCTLKTLQVGASSFYRATLRRCGWGSSVSCLSKEVLWCSAEAGDSGNQSQDELVWCFCGGRGMSVWMEVWLRK